MSYNATCHKVIASEESPPLFQNGNVMFQAHHVGWIIAGSLAFIATVTSFWLINKHLQWYTNKREQRYIVRILFMVPIYALVSLASYVFWNHATPLLLVRDAYEATVLTAFFYLLLSYVHPEPDGQRSAYIECGISKEADAMARKHAQRPRKWMFPLGFVRSKPADGLYFLQIMKWGVLQYCVIRPTTTLAALVLEYNGLYCEESWSPGWGHVYITAIISVSVTIAMYCLIQVYLPVAPRLKERKVVLKLFAVKAVVFLTFWQATFLSLLSTFGVVKDSKYMTAGDINVGIGAILETFEMAIFAFLHIKAFSYRPYIPAPRSAPSEFLRRIERAARSSSSTWPRTASSAAPGHYNLYARVQPPQRTARLPALAHALDPRPTLRELYAACAYVIHRVRGREPMADVRAKRGAVWQAVFPDEDLDGQKRMDEGVLGVRVHVEKETTVHVNRERQWLGIGKIGRLWRGSDSARGGRADVSNSSGGLGETIDRELQRRGITAFQRSTKEDEGYDDTKEDVWLEEPKQEKRRSWWRGMYDRLAGVGAGHEPIDNGNYEDDDKMNPQVRRLSRSSRWSHLSILGGKGNSDGHGEVGRRRRLLRRPTTNISHEDHHHNAYDHDERDVLVLENSQPQYEVRYDDPPPPSVIRAYSAAREGSISSRATSTRHSAAAVALLTGASGDSERRVSELLLALSSSRTIDASPNIVDSLPAEPCQVTRGQKSLPTPPSGLPPSYDAQNNAQLLSPPTSPPLSAFHQLKSSQASGQSFIPDLKHSEEFARDSHSEDVERETDAMLSRMFAASPRRSRASAQLPPASTLTSPNFEAVVHSNAPPPLTTATSDATCSGSMSTDITGRSLAGASSDASCSARFHLAGTPEVLPQRTVRASQGVVVNADIDNRVNFGGRVDHVPSSAPPTYDAVLLRPPAQSHQQYKRSASTLRDESSLNLPPPHALKHSVATDIPAILRPSVVPTTSSRFEREAEVTKREPDRGRSSRAQDPNDVLTPSSPQSSSGRSRSSGPAPWPLPQFNHTVNSTSAPTYDPYDLTAQQQRIRERGKEMDRGGALRLNVQPRRVSTPSSPPTAVYGRGDPHRRQSAPPQPYAFHLQPPGARRPSAEAPSPSAPTPSPTKRAFPSSRTHPHMPQVSRPAKSATPASAIRGPRPRPLSVPAPLSRETPDYGAPRNSISPGYRDETLYTHPYAQAQAHSRVGIEVGSRGSRRPNERASRRVSAPLGVIVEDVGSGYSSMPGRWA